MGETLKNRVSDRHDVMCKTDRCDDDAPSHVSFEGHLEKVGDP